MMISTKAPWCHPAQITWAAFHLKHTVARPAVEVVVVIQVSNFIACLCSRDLDRGQFLLFREGLDGTVNGGNAEPRHLIAGGIQDLLRR